MNELIDKKKIYDRAVEAAQQGKNWYSHIEMNDLNFMEQIMFFGFIYIELLSQLTPMPNKLKNQNIRAINTALQKYATDIENYREFSKRQIELIIPTEEKSSELAKRINEHKYDEALEIAVELLDIYAFGIAKSNIYMDLLEKSKNNE